MKVTNPSNDKPRGLKVGGATIDFRGSTRNQHRATVMTYNEWRTRLGSNLIIQVNPHLSAVAAALREYSARFDAKTLAALENALAEWRRAWPPGTVSSADPTADLYEQVRAAGRMPWGDPVALVNRMVYETRVSLLVTFGNLVVQASALPDMHGMIANAVTIGLASSHVEEKVTAPLTGGVHLPPMFATGTLDKAITGGKPGYGIGNLEKAYANRKLTSRVATLTDQKSVAMAVDRPALLALFKEYVNKIWEWLDGVLTVTWADFKTSVKAYVEDPEGLKKDIAEMLMELAVPGILAYLKPGVSLVAQWKGALNDVWEHLSGEAESWRQMANSDLHAGLLASVERGSYWRAVGKMAGGGASIAGIAMHISNPLAGKLVGLSWSLTKAIVTIILRFRESRHLNALADEARTYLARDGYAPGCDVDLDKCEVSFARKGWEFDKWFLKHAHWTPAAGAIAVSEKVCDTAAFFWVFDSRGYIREGDYAVADSRMRKVENDANQYLKESGLYRMFCRREIAVKGKWEVPQELKAAALAAQTGSDLAPPAELVATRL